MHVVCAAGESAQHALGVTTVAGLLECVGIDLEGCVGAKDEGPGMQCVYGLRLFLCEPLHICDGLLRRTARLIDVRRDDVEGETDLREELAASRRGGGEDEPHDQASASMEMDVSSTCASCG